MRIPSPAGLLVLGPVERKDTYRLYPLKVIREELFSDSLGILTLINSESAQVMLKRVDLAFQAYLRRVWQGKQPGFPHFQHTGQFSGFGFQKHEGDWRLLARHQSAHRKLRPSGSGQSPIRNKTPAPGGLRRDGIFFSGGK
ncbi:hypothetical protein KZZ20_08255 [Methylacidiphilum fumariolicum]|uniref:Uncharacterized protein n=2 Tax=Candidatus Methylacidiphilum fumarolicum TaxID=591154 RepID=I0K0N7_METFB|nr:hypothetical protein [Candidatus Methylacidiphilum fumarolicum]MBW6415500.1 hypothetical protein [Candidatus Methylacidiphilum fumarolicum]CAI9085733.1 conserved protein of unknown function [Candidatus Methylacidiphilum fumarolicum]CCG93056.1 hypothetical protein MFUM_90051 [Methylacidiphilum fumariolicum SolV]